MATCRPLSACPFPRTHASIGALLVIAATLAFAACSRARSACVEGAPSDELECNGDPKRGPATSRADGGAADRPQASDSRGVVQDPDCSPGQHKCNGTCVSNAEIASCGNACEPCIAPQGGRATCDGFKCGSECPEGQRDCLGTCQPKDAPCGGCEMGKNPCNGTCVEATSLEACGSACRKCPNDPNGTAKCDGDKCELACKPGFHACGDRCAPDNDPQSCGTSCTPCSTPTGGTATCENGTCSATCPGTLVLCKDACIASGTPCNGECDPGTKRCGNRCVPVDDVNFCASDCTACKPPRNAAAKCTGGMCGFDCRPGYHRCGDECVDDTSVATCGTSCMACRAPANATPSCDGKTCDWRCNMGFHRCGDACVSSSSPSSCGTSCEACPDNGGTATCVSGRCDFDCPNGRKCNGRCTPLDMPCNNMCGMGQTLCGGKCVATNAVPAEICNNNQDDDCDGRTDCADSNCGNGTTCGANRICEAGQCNLACGDGPGQTCCENASRDCRNNCGTQGRQTCRGGRYGACSVSDTCCGDPACTNNCGEPATRTCNGTNFSPCPARACCPRPETCTNRTDDDCDGRIDCADSDCGNGTGCGGGNICMGGTCQAPCNADTRDCDTRNECTRGRNLCPSGCRPINIDGKSCNGGKGTCDGGVCKECRSNSDCVNQLGHTCAGCGSDFRCTRATNNGTICGSGTGVCRNAKCDPCGDAGQACCPTGGGNFQAQCGECTVNNGGVECECRSNRCTRP